MNQSKKLVIFGTAEVAELAHYYFSTDSELAVHSFVVDDNYFKEDKFCGLPVLPLSEALISLPPKDYLIHAAISYAKQNALRKEIYLRLKALGYAFASYISSHSYIAANVSFGENCFILEDQTLQYSVNIGNNVVIWSGNHIGHGSVIQDHSYISSHVVICGHCNIGEMAFLGVNSAIADFCKVGARSFVSMQTKVSQDLPEGAVIVPSPSQVYDVEDKRSKAIRRIYFGR